jgi:hypothetical protein
MLKKKMTGREVLEEALRRCCSDYCDQYPRYEGEIDLGDDYENYMNNLIKRSKNPFPRYFNSVGRRVAGIVAAILIVFSCSMAVSAVRGPVAEFLVDVYAEFIKIYFGDDDIAKAPKTLETIYTLGVIPDGYEMGESFVGTYMTNLTWINENGDRLALSQDVLGGSLILDAEGTNYDVVEWNNKKIVCAEKYGRRFFFWNSTEYAFTLTVSSDISVEEVLALIDSLIKYN